VVVLLSDFVKIVAGEAGIVYESSNQKTRVFLVQFELTSCSLVHTDKMFGEMTVRA
jgi:hypothetical protein